MSESTLYRRLTEAADTTPSALLTQVRIDEAKTLLRDGEPATQVAYAVGYKSLSAFDRAFADAVGTTPSSYAGETDAQVPSPPLRPRSSASQCSSAPQRLRVPEPPISSSPYLRRIEAFVGSSS